MNITVELLGVLIALIGVLLTVVAQALYIAYKLGKLEQKLMSLDEKQNKHNNIIERTYCNERDIAVIKEQIDVENHRISDLEKEL